MYHPEVIADRRETLNRALVSTLPGGLVDLPVEESRARALDLADAVDAKGQAVRALTAAEQRFILNEQLLSKIDFAYWAERYGTISITATAVGPMYPLWESQRLILAELGRIEHDHWASGHPDGVLALILKARQLGASTLAEALVAHRTTTHANTQAIIASDEPESSARMFRIYERFLDHLPWFLRPTLRFDVKNQEKVYGNGSRVEVDAGKSTRGTEGKRGQIGRSGTYAVLHLTELSTWENPGQIDDALMPAVPFSLQTLALFESTAKGFNWWYRLWKLAEEGKAGPSGHRFYPIFIPWYAEPAKYWLPPPPDWSPNATTLAVAERARAFGPKWLHAPVELAREQLYWYEFSRSTAEEKEVRSEPGSLAKFLEEYPSDPEEAFQHGGRSIFPILVREQIRATARPLVAVAEILPAKDLAFRWAGRRPGLDYETGLHEALRARGIDPGRWDDPALAPQLTPQLAAFDPGTDPLRLPAGTALRVLSRRETTALLQTPGEARLHALEGLVLIWEFPRRTERYVLGVDVAEGIDRDRSVVSVVRVGSIERPDEEVAQFVSAEIDPTDLAYVADLLGRLYSDRDGSAALCAIECNNFGLQTQSEMLRHLGYANFFIWQYEDAARPESRYTYKFGWWTSTRTRPLIVGRLIRAVKTRDPVTGYRDVQINSPHTIYELGHFQQPPGEAMAMAAAAPGAHDDCLMALAIGIHVAQTLQFESGEPVADRRQRLAEEAFRARVASQAAVEAGAVDAAGVPQFNPQTGEVLDGNPRRAQNTDASADEVEALVGEGWRAMETDADGAGPWGW